MSVAKRWTGSPEGGSRADRAPSWIAVALFVLALGVRLLFWQATVDAEWPGSAYYKGDAWVWLDYATALEREVPFELGIPLRPPGMAYLLNALWDGGLPALWAVSMRWVVMGALAVVLFFIAARRAFGLKVGILTGLICAGSSGLMMLSTSLNNETPYLVLLGGIFILSDTLLRSPRPLPVAAWAVLNALACLVRVEHALFFLLALAWLGQRWLAERQGGWPTLGVALAAFGLTLTPWQLGISRAIDDFNHEPPVLAPAAEHAQLAQERALAYLEWEPEATVMREEMPAFVRRSAGNFVAATVAHRGRSVVTASDFSILEQAFGYRPAPLAGHPFIVSTGGLNFCLANHAAAAAGFSPAPLDARPPLGGGPGAYPPALVAGLPPPELALSYPAHLRLVNEGYRLGWEWIRQRPAEALRLAGHKLGIFWRGAALGLTGWNLPLGAGGLRRPVDLVTPEGTWPAVWRWLLLIPVGWGLALAWRQPVGLVWVLFLASKVVVAVLFYGYARQGATAMPVIALALALVGGRLLVDERWPPRRLLRLGAIAALLLVGVEAGRFFAAPELTIDGRRIGKRNVPAPADHAAHTIGWR